MVSPAGGGANNTSRLAWHLFQRETAKAERLNAGASQQQDGKPK